MKHIMQFFIIFLSLPKKRILAKQVETKNELEEL